MKREEIITEISQIVYHNLGLNVPTDEKIFSSTEIDSLDMLSITMDIESKFNIEIPDDTVIEIVKEEHSIESLADKLIAKYSL